MNKCPHNDFSLSAVVTRIEEKGRFQADIRIRCTDCGLPFRFIGLPAGLDLNGAATSVDATEARLAIAPRGEVVSALEGCPVGFSIRKVELTEAQDGDD